jgi:hypothetical protein
MPYMPGDRVTITDLGSVYAEYWGTVVQYFDHFDLPKVEVKLDGYVGTRVFDDTALALGELKDVGPAYEYNLRKDGRIYYDSWSTTQEMTALWNVDTLEEVKERAAIYGGTLVRRVKSEIEDV